MKWAAVLAIALAAGPVVAQDQDEPVTVSAEHPRLLLRPARLRLLRRERERTSARWQQLDLLVRGNAPMVEPGLAYALYYQVSDDREVGRRAVTWALKPEAAADIRQEALVYDWCQKLLTDAERRELESRLAKALAPARAGDSAASVSDARNRAFAAIALFDHVEKSPQRELEWVVRTWWRNTTAALRKGSEAIKRDDALAVFELLHAMRDNTNLDLRETYPKFFKDYPIAHLSSYYPAVLQGPDTEYRILAERTGGDLDLRRAARARTAEMEMVAFDTNAAETQVLQGWLMHDRFMLRDTYGTPYEFLWANPYQPGLSYFHVPLTYHNEDFGTIFARASWDDSAAWFGHFEGVMQLFEEGRVKPIDGSKAQPPLSMGEALICFGRAEKKFQLDIDEEEVVFVVGLTPRAHYLVEIDDQEMYEAETDGGGILEIQEIPLHHKTSLRLREAGSE